MAEGGMMGLVGRMPALARPGSDLGSSVAKLRERILADPALRDALNDFAAANRLN